MPRNRRKPDHDQAADRAAIRAVALDLLARREHSRSELHEKLVMRGWDDAAAAAEIDALASEGLQSDARFIEAFIKSRIERGQGPVRIAYELRRRGIDDVDAALVEMRVDWRAAAAKARERRFGAERPGDWASRSKQLRFLEQRGFTAEQAYAALDGFDGTEA